MQVYHRCLLTILSRYLLLVSLLLLCCASHESLALRCYTCQDCDETSQLKDMEICGAPTIPPAAAAPAPAPAPATAGATTRAPAAAAGGAGGSASGGNNRPPAAAGSTSDEDDDEEYSEDSDDAPAATATKPPPKPVNNAAGGKPTAAPATVKPAAPAAASLNTDEDEDEDEDDDYDDRRRRQARQATQQQQQQQQPDVEQIAVCYIARLSLNDTIITNRGCTMLANGNSSGACEALFNGWDVAGCETCQWNGCNAPEYGTGGVWSATAASCSSPWSLIWPLAMLLTTYGSFS